MFRGVSRYRLAAVAALLAALLLVVIAAALTLGNADGVWSNARDDGGNTNVSCVQYVGDNTVSITQGVSVEDENDVRYGRSGDGCLYTQTELDKKSGFGFDGSDGDLIFEPGQVFLLGELTHYNRPIFAWHLLHTVDLAISLAFSDPALNTTLNYALQLDETPNNPDDNPGDKCPYGDSTGDGCDDKVFFPSALPDQVFDIGGKTYTLQIVGFVPGTAATCSADDDILANFVTGEDQESEACLFGRILEVAYDYGDAPDIGGQTLLATDGARHTIDPNGPYLGCTQPDADPDGQPSATAMGDDTLDGDDEDGCSFVFPDDDFSDGSGSVEVTVDGLQEFSSACVMGWIDWDDDGFANDPMSAVTATANGPVTLVFTTSGDVPASNYMRLRVMPGECPEQTLGAEVVGPGPTGLLQGGEVEDFVINAPTAVGLVALGAVGGGGTAVFALLGAALAVLSAAVVVTTRRFTE